MYRQVEVDNNMLQLYGVKLTCIDCLVQMFYFESMKTFKCNHNARFF